MNNDPGAAARLVGCVTIQGWRFVPVHETSIELHDFRFWLPGGGQASYEELRDIARAWNRELDQSKAARDRLREFLR